MNYFDLNDDINEISNIPTTAQVGNQPMKDLSDWRNIQLGTPTPILDRYWMPTTVNPWTTPNTPSTYNQSWPMTLFPTNPGYPLMNFNSPPTLQNLTPADPTNDIIDLTINASTPVRDFIPVQNTITPPETELIVVPEIDIEEILAQVEAVIPDIDIDAARRTITAMNPIPSTNDIVTNFLDNGYTRKLKKSFDHDRNISLKRSWLETIDDIPKFLTSYSDPISYFYDTQRKQSELYVNHAKAFLLRAFPTTDKSILEQILQEENNHFLPATRRLETQLGIRTNAFLQRTAIRKSLDMFGM